MYFFWGGEVKNKFGACSMIGYNWYVRPSVCLSVTLCTVPKQYLNVWIWSATRNTILQLISWQPPTSIIFLMLPTSNQGRWYHLANTLITKHNANKWTANISTSGIVVVSKLHGYSRVDLSAIAGLPVCFFYWIAVLLKEIIEVCAMHAVRRIYPEFGGSIYTADTQAATAG